MLTIFYDGHCPLCLAEMKQLKKWDTQNLLQLEDIQAENFTERFPHIDPIKADRFLHGQTADGSILLGLDVTCLAWKLVNRHKWMQMLRWPLIRIFADMGYRLFARHRHSISAFIMGKAACQACKKGECRL